MESLLIQRIRWTSALIAEFRNSAFVKEVEQKTPLFYSSLQGALKNAVEYNKIAHGAASRLSTRVKSSAYLTYRNSDSSAWLL